MSSAVADWAGKDSLSSKRWTFWMHLLLFPMFSNIKLSECCVSMTPTPPDIKSTLLSPLLFFWGCWLIASLVVSVINGKTVCVSLTCLSIKFLKARVQLIDDTLEATQAVNKSVRLGRKTSSKLKKKDNKPTTKPPITLICYFTFLWFVFPLQLHLIWQCIIFFQKSLTRHR